MYIYSGIYNVIYRYLFIYVYMYIYICVSVISIAISALSCSCCDQHCDYDDEHYSLFDCFDCLLSLLLAVVWLLLISLSILLSFLYIPTPMYVPS